MIEILDVRKSFGALEVLRGVTLTVNKGEVVSVIGGSGSGKSTLLMCINGLESIEGGRIAVDGIDLSRQQRIEIDYIPAVREKERSRQGHFGPRPITPTNKVVVIEEVIVHRKCRGRASRAARRPRAPLI